MVEFLLRHAGHHCLHAHLSPQFSNRNVVPLGTTAKEEMERFRKRTLFQIALCLPVSVSTTGLFPWWCPFATVALVLPWVQGFLWAVGPLGPCELWFSFGTCEVPVFGTSTDHTAKFALVFPRLYHTWNGIRYLMWDIGKGLCLQILLELSSSIPYRTTIMEGSSFPLISKDGMTAKVPSSCPQFAAYSGPGRLHCLFMLGLGLCWGSAFGFFLRQWGLPLWLSW